MFNMLRSLCKLQLLKTIFYALFNLMLEYGIENIGENNIQI